MIISFLCCVFLCVFLWKKKDDWQIRSTIVASLTMAMIVYGMYLEFSAKPVKILVTEKHTHEFFFQEKETQLTFSSPTEMTIYEYRYPWYSIKSSVYEVEVDTL